MFRSACKARHVDITRLIMVKSKIYTTLCWQSPEKLAAPSEIQGRSQRCALEVEPSVAI
jgi:hypothetical protein